MDPDDAVDILDEVEEGHRDILLSNLPADDAEELRMLLSFDPDTAAGVMNTHSSVADGRQEIFTAHAALCGAGRVTLKGLMDAVSVDACIDLLNKDGLRDAVLARIGAAIEKRLALRLRGKARAEFIMFTGKYGILAQSSGSRALCERLKEIV